MVAVEYLSDVGEGHLCYRAYKIDRLVTRRRLKQDGILDKLHDAGAVDGDTIRIKEVEFILTD